MQVLWAYMVTGKLEEAIKSLKDRDGTPSHNISYVLPSSGECRSGVIPGIAEEVKQWASEKNIDAIIWTDLQQNFEKKTNKSFTAENVVDYLKNLGLLAKRKAEEYVRKTPSQVKTGMRGIIENELG